MPEKIAGFFDEYRFLSNFYPSLITVQGMECPTVEHAYQALKFEDPAVQALVIMQRTPGQAKREGQQHSLRSGWEMDKLQVMRVLLAKKFRIDYLHGQLLATGSAELEETNYWGDTYWGVCKGEGTNHLGRLLMELRAEHSNV